MEGKSLSVEVGKIKVVFKKVQRGDQGFRRWRIHDRVKQQNWDGGKQKLKVTRCKY